MPREMVLEAPHLSIQADAVTEDWVRRVDEHLLALEAPEPA